jgi:DNA polymerase I
MLEEVFAMSTIFRAPLNDVTRFISGTLVGLLVSSFSRHNGMVLQWYKEGHSSSKYIGGYVMSPKVGLHSDIVVFDFSSLYPSIIMSANISPETIRALTDPSEILDTMEYYNLEPNSSASEVIQLRYDSSTICLMIGSEIGLIDRTRPGISHDVMKYLMDVRNSLEDRKSPKGWALKIGANSYYGALGSPTSGLGMRFAAAAVTALGRILIERLIRFLGEMGFTIVYGDTDSVFINCGTRVRSDDDRAHTRDGGGLIGDILTSFHSSLKGTVFGHIVLNYENTYRKLILLKPKMYYGIDDETDSVVIKGMSTKRRDRPNIAREIAGEVCSIICRSGSTEERNRLVSDYLYKEYCMVRSGKVDRLRCMLETKEGPNLVWKYMSVEGNMITIEKDKYIDATSPPFSPTWIISYIKRSLVDILAASDVMPFERLIEHAQDRCDDLDNVY